MRKALTDSLAKQLSEKVDAIGRDKAYDWFIDQVRKHSLNDVEQFKVVVAAGGINAKPVLVRKAPWNGLETINRVINEPKPVIVVDEVPPPVTPGQFTQLVKRRKAKAHSANHNRSATRARQASASSIPGPTPSSSCMDAARKFCGVAPYNEPGNYIVGDGYFANDCRKKYGDKNWERACALVREERK